jgi:single-strand DNA-binding protein
MADLKMPEMNKVFLAGRLTRDPELRYISSGTAVCDMRLAVSRYNKDRDGQRQEETLYIRVTTWAKLAEFCGEYLKKGRPVLVEGRLRSNEWEDKQTGQKRTSVEVTANSVQTLDWEDRGGGGGGQRAQAPANEGPVPEDDIPF